MKAMTRKAEALVQRIAQSVEVNLCKRSMLFRSKSREETKAGRDGAERRNLRILFQRARWDYNDVAGIQHAVLSLTSRQLLQIYRADFLVEAICILPHNFGVLRLCQL